MPLKIIANMMKVRLLLLGGLFCSLEASFHLWAIVTHLRLFVVRADWHPHLHLHKCEQVTTVVIVVKTRDRFLHLIYY